MSSEPAKPINALLDPAGCLTEVGLAALKSAEPGHAPQELAEHVRGCSRCQARLLAGVFVHATLPRPQSATVPPLWRLTIVAFMALLMVLSFWYLGVLLSPQN